MQDVYYRKAKECGYRARSAFKLLQIERHFGVLAGSHDGGGARSSARCVVDLCAAPGGWSEVVADQLLADDATRENFPTTGATTGAAASASSSSSVSPPLTPARIVAVDLQMMAPLPGVHFIKGDLTRAATAQLILAALGQEEEKEIAEETSVESAAALPSSPRRLRQRLADVVLCDGAPDVTGLHDVDEAVQHALTLSALNVALHVLKPSDVNDNGAEGMNGHAATAAGAVFGVGAPQVASSAGASAAAASSALAVAAPPSPPHLSGGAFVAKVFRGPGSPALFALLRVYFARVTLAKPAACRHSSIEAFVVAQGYRGLERAGQAGRSLEGQPLSVAELPEGWERSYVPVPFVSCGEGEGEQRLDSDRTYPLSFQFARKTLLRPVLEHAIAEDAAQAATAAAAGAPTSASAVRAGAPIDPPYRAAVEMRKQQQQQRR
jgi:tRNA (cytidine32/guanosine34-2'-O)-methyltransferase